MIEIGNITDNMKKGEIIPPPIFFDTITLPH